MFKACFDPDSDVLLKSDCDEQLLLYIPFNEAVKLKDIRIKAPADGSGPKTVKLYINQPNLGFSDMEDIAPVQELELTEQQLNQEGPAIPLKFVKFQHVTSLTIFIENNHNDDEVTTVSRIQLYGQPIHGFNVAEIKKVKDGE
eukprot:TRINITY_DN1236_c0_g1_i1.p2 TRINITY_DN1236_c0_g1~~TRINITY_DN1236_c0_g1_i1.p2  ORF type:complete len:143 (-),score=35.44 TRINITY_DN1236_c0_g1_i1:934-1362(-)